MDWTEVVATVRGLSGKRVAVSVGERDGAGAVPAKFGGVLRIRDQEEGGPGDGCLCVELEGTAGDGAWLSLEESLLEESKRSDRTLVIGQATMVLVFDDLSALDTDQHTQAATPTGR